MSEPRIPTSPRVALEPREETTCSRCGTRCLDYRSPGPVCIGCVDEERRAAEAQVARLRGAVEELAGCVRHYRDMYQRHGGDALDTGRAWDLMRRAEHAALAALSPAAETPLGAAPLTSSVLACAVAPERDPTPGEGERSIDECPICGRWMPAFGGEVFDGTTETCSGCKAEVTAIVVGGQLVTEATPSPFGPRASRREP